MSQENLIKKITIIEIEMYNEDVGGDHKGYKAFLCLL